MDEVTYIIVALALTSSRSASFLNLNSSSLNDNSSIIELNSLFDDLSQECGI